MGGLPAVAGHAKTCTNVAIPIDTNILVYRYGARFPEKQRVATDILRQGIKSSEVWWKSESSYSFHSGVFLRRILLPTQALACLFLRGYT